MGFTHPNDGSLNKAMPHDGLIINLHPKQCHRFVHRFNCFVCDILRKSIVTVTIFSSNINRFITCRLRILESAVACLQMELRQRGLKTQDVSLWLVPPRWRQQLQLMPAVTHRAGTKKKLKASFASQSVNSV